MFIDAIDPTKDLAFKKVFGSQETVEILAGFVGDFFGVYPKELRIDNPYDIRAYTEIVARLESCPELMEDGMEIRKLRATISDLDATMEMGDYTSELQMRMDPHFAERSLYYPFRKFASRHQLAAGGPCPYSLLRPIYAMNILGYRHIPSDDDALRIFELHDPKRKKAFPKRLLHIGYFELPKSVVETDNQRDWQSFFLRRPLSATAPDYIRKAASVIERANMRKEEIDMLTRLEYMEWKMAGELEGARMEGREQGLLEGLLEGRLEEKAIWQAVVGEKELLIQSKDLIIKKLEKELMNKRGKDN